jgi:hypothetical protein
MHQIELDVFGNIFTDFPATADRLKNLDAFIDGSGLASKRLSELEACAQDLNTAAASTTLSVYSIRGSLDYFVKNYLSVLDMLANGAPIDLNSGTKKYPLSANLKTQIISYINGTVIPQIPQLFQELVTPSALYDTTAAGVVADPGDKIDRVVRRVK